MLQNFNICYLQSARVYSYFQGHPLKWVDEKHCALKNYVAVHDRASTSSDAGCAHAPHAPARQSHWLQLRRRYEHATDPETSDTSGLSETDSEASGSQPREPQIERECATIASELGGSAAEISRREVRLPRSFYARTERTLGSREAAACERWQ